MNIDKETLKEKGLVEKNEDGDLVFKESGRDFKKNLQGDDEAALIYFTIWMNSVDEEDGDLVLRSCAEHMAADLGINLIKLLKENQDKFENISVEDNEDYEQAVESLDKIIEKMN